MRVVRRVALALLVIVVAVVAGGIWYEWPLLRTGSGYAVHNACAVKLVAGRAEPDDDLPDNPLRPFLTGYVNTAGRSATGAVAWVLAKQKAWYEPGFGCTVADERPALPRATKVDSGPNPYTDAPVPQMSAEMTQALDHAFGDDLSSSAAKTLGTRGIVVLKDGKLVGERYAEGFDADTPQLGWSMSKSATNLVLGIYAKERGFDLDSDQLLPQWTDERASITLDQLERMTSGLQWDETYALGTPVTEMLYNEADMGAYAASLPLAHQPGTYQQYSSGSTNIVCSWLTAQPDVPDADFPRTRLFSPLGLSSAVWEVDASGRPVCSSYLWATPRDWGALGQFALQNGVWGGKQLLPEDWMAKSTTATPVAASEETGYAAGWWVNQLADGSLRYPDLPADTYWASGHDGQRVFVVPSENLVVVRLGFSPTISGDEQLRTEQLVADLVTATAPAPEG